jgi:NhaP-type Na+/H+ or K+/H+ antiporter
MPFRVRRDARLNLDGWIAGASGNLLLECSTIKIGDDPASTMEHQLITTFVAIAVLGIGAQWLAWRLHLPAIILLAVFGVVSGPVLGWLNPTEDLGAVLAPIIKLGVAIVLFEGGLTLRLHELKQAAIGVKRLVSWGVALSWTFGSAAAFYIGGLSWPVALVFGAITVVTGPTVIIPLLRQAKLKRRPASYLKWEGIINDPTGALLAVVTFEYFMHTEGGGLTQIVTDLGLGLTLAGLLGFGGAQLLGTLFRHGQVAEYLKGPVALGMALLIYALSNVVLEESGLLATTIMGITLGNLRLPGLTEMRRFKEYIAILLVSSVFIVLTADLDPDILFRLEWRSLALLGAIIFIARPLTIFLATIGAGMSWQERALLGWIAPRGIVAAAVAGVFAPQLQAQGYAGADLLLPLVFALIFLTVTLHGLSIGSLARRLGLSAEGSNGVLIVGCTTWSVALAQILKDRAIPVTIADSSWNRLSRARLQSIPVYYGEMLSESAEATLELNEVSHLLAATDNDAYNSLVCRHYAGDLGRHHVYQLPPQEERETRQLASGVRGHIVPPEKTWYDDLIVKWYNDWQFQKTRLTAEYTYDDFLHAIPKQSMVFARISETGNIRFNTVERDLKPKVGDTVIWYGPKREKKDSDRKDSEKSERKDTGVTDSESDKDTS